MIDYTSKPEGNLVPPQTLLEYGQALYYGLYDIDYTFQHLSKSKESKKE